MSRWNVVAQMKQITDHLRDPLYRNGYALTLSTIITSALGVFYWIVVARTFSPEIVGLNSATIAAMYLIANITQLNLTSILNRYLPDAAQHTPRLLLATYAISGSVGLAGGLIFVMGLDIWSPDLKPILGSPGGAIYFALAIATWGVFVLQDSAFVGFRAAVWVPVENFIFAVIKLLMLIPAAVLLPQQGIYVSWTLAVVFIIIPVNYLIFRYLIPRHIEATKHKQGALPSIRSLQNFILWDYLGHLAYTGLHSILPLMVLAQLGSAANAYFYLVLTIVTSLYMISQNMGMSMIVEAASTPDKLVEYATQTIRQSLRIVVPLVAGTVIAAPLVLTLFGAEYSVEGTNLLRLLALAAIPETLIAIYLGVIRVQNRTRNIFVVLVVQAVLILGGSSFLMPTYGITGIGVVWVLSTSIIAVFLLLTEFRFVWARQPATAIQSTQAHIENHSEQGD